MSRTGGNFRKKMVLKKMAGIVDSRGRSRSSCSCRGSSGGSNITKVEVSLVVRWDRYTPFVKVFSIAVIVDSVAPAIVLVIFSTT